MAQFAPDNIQGALHSRPWQPGASNLGGAPVPWQQGWSGLFAGQPGSGIGSNKSQANASNTRVTKVFNTNVFDHEGKEWNKELYMNFCFFYRDKFQRDRLEAENKFSSRSMLQKRDEPDFDESYGNPIPNMVQTGEVVSLVTMVQANAIIAFSANSYAKNNPSNANMPLQDVLAYFKPGAVCITPPETRAHYASPVLVQTFTIQGEADINNVWGRAVRPHQGLYFILKPSIVSEINEDRKIFFRYDSKAGKNNQMIEMEPSIDYIWQIVPWVSTDGMDPSLRDISTQIGKGEVFGHFWKVGRVSELIRAGSQGVGEILFLQKPDIEREVPYNQSTKAGTIGIYIDGNSQNSVL